ncbi:MAG: protein kinase [Pyrinomonadaceae bacterium]|nr:protein kinase [Pyrinomonadaceae bacterium]
MIKCPQCSSEISAGAVVCGECGLFLNQKDKNEPGAEGTPTKILDEKQMTPEEWKKIKELFTQAQNLEGTKRSEFLDNECADAPDRKEQVLQLLHSIEEEAEFLEAPAVAEVASLLVSGDASGDPDEPGKGRLKQNDLLDGRYRINRLLGKGGMGEVYLASDTKLDRKVALKVLPSDLTESKLRLQRFEQEARAVSALNHPHILTIYEFGKSTDGEHFIATEFVKGKTLNEHGSYTDLALSRVLDIAMQVTSALAAAHEAGITHRDIKPDNIMVRDDGYIKVLDFGLAKLTETQTTGEPDSEATTKALVDTAPGSVMGTAAYMSPEQARGLSVDARTDIWSVGVVLYELITGRKPFRGETSTDTIISVIKKEPAPIGNFVADLPSEVEWVVSKTLSKDRDGRYQTAKELHADLAKIRNRIEFSKEQERSGTPDPVSSGESKTINLEQMPTAGDEVGQTNELTKGAPSEIARTESSLEYVVATASSHKFAAIGILAVLLAGALAIGYVGIYGLGSGENIDSLAVLPFENGSKDEKLRYLSDGLSESLIDRLSQLPQLKVIARNSSFKFRGDTVDVKDVADKLGVRAIVMGRVVQLNGDLTIRVEVIDAEEDKQLWSETYSRKADDVLSVQNEIAKTVTEKLRLRLTNDQQIRLADGGTTNAEAYRHYLNGLIELRGPQDIRGNALSQFQKAVELDPGFAQAHTEISFVYSGQAAGSGNPKELMPKAKEAANRALAIDADSAKAHVALAIVYEFEFNWAAAEKEYKRAIELNPNLETTRTRYAFYLSIMDREQAALEEIRQAQMRDPANLRMVLLWKGIVLTQSRKFVEAIELYKEAQGLDPSGSTMHFDFGYAYAGKGDYEAAAESFEKSVDIVGGKNKYSQALVYLAAAYAKIPEKREEAVLIANRLKTTNEYVSPALIAVIYAALDENDKAIKALERAYNERDLLLRYIGVGYEYDGLRKDPRFQELLKKTGLAN